MIIKPKSSRTKGIIASSFMVFALIAQPMYGLVASQVAEAMSAADIFVNATGGNDTNDCKSATAACETIQTAIGKATAGNTISVAEGEYNEKVSITKNLTLRGVAGAIINGPANSQAIEVQAQNNVLTNVTISGFTVNAGANSQNVINVSNGTTFFRGNLLMQDLTINGNNAPVGIGLMQTDGVTVDDVTINSVKTGIEAVGATNLSVTNSTITGSASAGVHVWNTAGYGPRNNTLNFTNNTLTNNTTGIKIDDARNVTISGGEIEGGQSAISAKDTQTLKINGVTMSGQSSSSNLAVVGFIGAVQYAEVTNNSITNAESTGATAQAILLGDTGTSGNLRYVTISGNTLTGISGARGAYGLMVNRPMSMETGAQLKFTNNTVSNINGTKWMAGVGLDRNTPNAEITGNTFSSLTTDEGTPVAINVNHREGNTSDVTKMTVKHNNFNTPGQLGVNYDWATGTALATSKYLDASENYWGDLPGPAKGTSATAGQYVTYSNWLCQSDPDGALSTGDSKGCVQPIVTYVTPGEGNYISGTKRIYINISNPEVMNGGFLQLNKEVESGNPANNSRTNYPIKQDDVGKWYAEIDTKNIVARNGTSHQGDGKYLFRVEAHHKYGHSEQHPWGYHGNNTNWAASNYYFIVDNTAPTVNITSKKNGKIGEYYSYKDARNVEGTITEVNPSETQLFRVVTGGEEEISGRLDITDTDGGKRFKVNNGLPEGTYYIVHTDKLGQESNKAYFVISNKPPLVSDVQGTEDIKRDSEIIVGDNTSNVTFTVGNGDNTNAVVDQVMIRGWVFDSSKSNNRGPAAFSDHVIDSNTDNYDIDLRNLLGDKWSDDSKFIIMIQARNQADVRDQYFFTVKVDLVPPEITINEEGNTSTLIKGTVGSDATEVWVKIGTGKEKKAIINSDGITWSLEINPPLAVGTTHNITARAVDAAKNTNSDKTTPSWATRPINIDPGHNSEEGPSGTNSQSPSGTTVITTPTRLAILQTTTNPNAIAANTTEDATADDEEVLGTSTTSERERSASVLAATDNKDENKVEWSIVNAIAAVITVLVSIIALAGISKKQGRSKTLSIVTIVPAIGAVVAFFMLENLSSPMVFLNAWSWLFVGVLAVQVFILAMTKQKSSDNE